MAAASPSTAATAASHAAAQIPYSAPNMLHGDAAAAAAQQQQPHPHALWKAAGAAGAAAAAATNMYAHNIVEWFKAVRASDLERMETILARGVDIEAKNPETNESALKLAVRHGLAECAQFLVEHGANIERAEGINGETPLTYAARYGQFAICQLLCELGADPDSRDNTGMSALHYASQFGRPRCIATLVHWGASINARDNSGETPLLNAAFNGQIDCIDSLLVAGADIEARDIVGKSAVESALDNNKVACATLLAQRLAEFNDNKIWVAAKEGNAVVLRALLDQKGRRPDDKGSNPITPLSWAARNGHLDCVRILLAFRADLKARGAHGMTPLLWAAQGGHVPIVKALSLAGADLTDTSHDGNAPLHYAVASGNAECVHVLLELGANPDHMNNAGLTAEHVASAMQLSATSGQPPPAGAMALLAGAPPVSKADLLSPRSARSAVSPATSPRHQEATSPAAKLGLASAADLLAELGVDPMGPAAVGAAPPPDLAVPNTFNAAPPMLPTTSAANAAIAARGKWQGFRAVSQLLARHRAKAKNFRGRYQLQDRMERFSDNSAVLEMATDEQRKKPVALKFLRDQVLAQRMLELYDAHISSEHALPLVEYFEDRSIHPDHPFCFVLEWGEETLADYLARKTPPAKEVRSIALELLKILAHLDQRGFVDTNFNPDNIMRQWDGSFRILFIDAVVPVSSYLPSTPINARYKPPEFLDLTDNLQARATAAYAVWQFGAVLYQLAAGAPLIPAAITAEEDMARHFGASLVIDVSAVEHGVCRTAVDRILQRDPNRRPSFDEIEDLGFFRGDTAPKLLLNTASDSTAKVALLQELVFATGQSDCPRLFVISPMPGHDCTSASAWKEWAGRMDQDENFVLHFLCEKSFHPVAHDPGYPLHQGKDFWRDVAAYAALQLEVAGCASGQVPFLPAELFEGVKEVDSDKSLPVMIATLFPEIQKVTKEVMRCRSTGTPLSSSKLLNTVAQAGIGRIRQYLAEFDRTLRRGGLVRVQPDAGDAMWLRTEHALSVIDAQKAAALERLQIVVNDMKAVEGELESGKEQWQREKQEWDHRVSALGSEFAVEKKQWQENVDKLAQDNQALESEKTSLEKEKERIESEMKGLLDESRKLTEKEKSEVQRVKKEVAAERKKREKVEKDKKKLEVEKRKLEEEVAKAIEEAEEWRLKASKTCVIL